MNNEPTYITTTKNIEEEDGKIMVKVSISDFNNIGELL